MTSPQTHALMLTGKIDDYSKFTKTEEIIVTKDMMEPCEVRIHPYSWTVYRYRIRMSDGNTIEIQGGENELYIRGSYDERIQIPSNFALDRHPIPGFCIEISDVPLKGNIKITRYVLGTNHDWVDLYLSDPSQYKFNDNVEDPIKRLKWANNCLNELQPNDYYFEFEKCLARKSAFGFQSINPRNKDEMIKPYEPRTCNKLRSAEEIAEHSGGMFKVVSLEELREIVNLKEFNRFNF